MILFLDCETQGKLPERGFSYQRVDNWPRIVQISWRLVDDVNIICKHDYYVKSNFIVENSSYHKVTQKIVEENGVNISIILQRLADDLSKCDLFVAHNVEFDWNVIRAEFVRSGIDINFNIPTFCTMQDERIMEFVGLQGRFDRYKWPKLGELYQKTFKRVLEGVHDSGKDIDGVIECYFELKRIGII